MADSIKFIQLDCHLDEKFDYIEAECGLVGFAVIVKLFQRIYGGEGYYCEWSDRLEKIFAHKIGENESVVRSVVSVALREGIFDERMYKKYQILTSRGIQKRFAEIAKRRSVIFDKPEYVVEGVILPKDKGDSGSGAGGSDVCNSGSNVSDKNSNVCNSASNVCNSQRNVCNETASKVKQSKVKQSEAKRTEAKQSESARKNHGFTEAPAFPTPPEPSVTPARPQNIDRNFLVEHFGEDQVIIYEEKFKCWSKNKNNVKVRMYEEMFKWMLQDNVTKTPRRSSFDMDEVMRKVKENYRSRQS